MKISEIKSGQGKIDVEGVLISKEDARTFNKYGKDLKVANAVLEDDSGKIKVSLWNDDADKFKMGDKIKIINGYASEFNGLLQLSSGKFGKIEHVGAESSAVKSTKKKEEVEEMEF